MFFIANLLKNGFLGATAQGKLLGQCVLLWVLIHFLISHLPQAIRTFDNAVASVL